MKRFVISTIETARVQYIVNADSEESARQMFNSGLVTKMVIDEHDADEIVDITEILNLSGG